MLLFCSVDMSTIFESVEMISSGFIYLNVSDGITNDEHAFACKAFESTKFNNQNHIYVTDTCNDDYISFSKGGYATLSQVNNDSTHTSIKSNNAIDCKYLWSGF